MAPQTTEKTLKFISHSVLSGRGRKVLPGCSPDLDTIMERFSNDVAKLSKLCRAVTAEGGCAPCMCALC